MGNRGFSEGARSMSDMTEEKTDRFRIIPHTPYVYRIERLYLIEIKKTKESTSIFKTSISKEVETKEIWKNFGRDIRVNHRHEFEYPESFSPILHGGLYWDRGVSTYLTVDLAKQKINEILEKEKKEEEFMKQEPVYV